MTAARPLDPALAELIKALARANAARDIRRARELRDSASATPVPTPGRAAA